MAKLRLLPEVGGGCRPPERIVFRLEAADIDAGGRAVLVLVDCNARQLLERVANVAANHITESLLGNDVHDAARGFAG